LKIMLKKPSNIIEPTLTHDNWYQKPKNEIVKTFFCIII
jgi:hypothetical protein